MEKDILNYLKTVMLRGTPCSLQIIILTFNFKHSGYGLIITSNVIDKIYDLI